MTTTRPALWPLHDLLGTNMITPENSLYMQSGYPVGLAVPSGDHNGKFRRSGDWSKYLDLNGLRNDDWLDDGSTFLAYRLTVDSLQYSNGGNVLGAGATVGKRGAYLINATRVETDATFLNPVGGTVQGDPLIYPLATAPGRIWVYANDAGQVRYDSVGVGVADSPGADEISLIGVDIDAAGVVTNGGVVPTTLALPDHQLGVTTPLWLFGTGRRLLISVTSDGNPALEVAGSSGPAAKVDNDHATEATLQLINANAAGPALDITGSTTCTGPLTIADTFAFVANGACTLGNAAGDVITVNGTTTFNAPVTIADGQAFIANGDVTLGNANTDVITVNGTTTFNAPISGDVTIASSAATPTLSVTNASSGRALSAISAGGYAAFLQSDTTSPVRAALNLVPQDADPSSPARGDLYFNSVRDVLRCRSLTQYQSIHSSPLGRVYGVEMHADLPGQVGTTGEICRVTIAPEAVGNVVLTASVFWDPADDATEMQVIIRDDTAGTNLVTRVVRAKDVDASGDRGESVYVRYVYTLPSAASREFVIILFPNAAADLYNPVLDVAGVY